ncbi:energy transducer TonB [Hymenobacter wooponensis]|uniref:TonB family protein n=1 Tax=Hymenobacter wooponensis TaxID=1525360 RepID=A0A4Z0ML07_9BACT|nr:energy transducer TonB [Hymenobacter wooponensis]TGD80241.1 TonB family protein [Hymenobacter wooponensis]
MTIRIATAIVALASTGAYAQQSEAPVPSKKIEYTDATNHKLPSEEGATRRIETTFRDSVSGGVREYYLPSGKLRSYVFYANLRKHFRHGTSTYFYESGQLQRKESYVVGKLEGERVTYYPDGTLKRRDQIVPGQPVTGECYGPDGKPVAYYPFETMPVYSRGDGSQQAVVQDVMNNTHYPQDALRQRVYGIVKIKFVVDQDGKVRDVRPEKTPAGAVPPNLADAYQQLQEAAITAVRQLKPFTPGRHDGEPVAVSYTVPLTFRIK